MAHKALNKMRRRTAEQQKTAAEKKNQEISHEKCVTTGSDPSSFTG